MLDTITAEQFEAFSGQPLALQAANASTPVTIIEVRRLSGPSTRAPAPFAVLLHAPEVARAWPQGLYRLVLPELAALDLFLVPIAADASGSTYEVVFN